MPHPLWVALSLRKNQGIQLETENNLEENLQISRCLLIYPVSPFRSLMRVGLNLCDLAASLRKKIFLNLCL